MGLSDNDINILPVINEVFITERDDPSIHDECNIVVPMSPSPKDSVLIADVGLPHVEVLSTMRDTLLIPHVKKIRGRPKGSKRAFDIFSSKRKCIKVLGPVIEIEDSPGDIELTATLDQVNKSNKFKIDGDIWLDDEIVEEAQNLIKKYHPDLDGLQCTVLGPVMQFEPKRSKPWIQIGYCILGNIGSLHQV